MNYEICFRLNVSCSISFQSHENNSVNSAADQQQRQASTVGAEGRRMIRVNKTKPKLGIAIEGGANTKLPLPRIARIQVGPVDEIFRGLKIPYTAL